MSVFIMCVSIRVRYISVCVYISVFIIGFYYVYFNIVEFYHTMWENA